MYTVPVYHFRPGETLAGPAAPIRRSVQAQETEHYNDHNDRADDVKNRVHGVSSSMGMNRETCFRDQPSFRQAVDQYRPSRRSTTMMTTMAPMMYRMEYMAFALLKSENYGR
jgi:hypothetical protein